MEINMIAAVENTGGIGWLGVLPWPNLSSDMQWFKNITTYGQVSLYGGCNDHKKRAVVMGRKTWQSIPHKFRPLPDRINIVMSRKTIDGDGDCYYSDGSNAAVNFCGALKVDEVYVIGGQQIYESFIQSFHIDNLYLTRVHKNYNCDRWFPQFNANHTSEVTRLKEDGIELSLLHFKGVTNAA